jgi:hypothetical protein
MTNKTEHFYAGHISDFLTARFAVLTMVQKIQFVWDVMLYGPVSLVVQTETWNSVAIWSLCDSE